MSRFIGTKGFYMKNKQMHIITMVVLLIVIGAGSFFVGTKYQQRKSVSNFRQQITGGQGQGRNAQNTDLARNRGQVPGFRQTIGEIISVDDKSITVKMTDGSSKIVLISDSTTINQSTTAAKTDLKVGINVAVNGDQNTDGSVSGRNIEINPRVATLTPAVKQ